MYSHILQMNFRVETITLGSEGRCASPLLNKRRTWMELLSKTSKQDKIFYHCLYLWCYGLLKKQNVGLVAVSIRCSWILFLCLLFYTTSVHKVPARSNVVVEYLKCNYIFSCEFLQLYGKYNSSLQIYERI